MEGVGSGRPQEQVQCWGCFWNRVPEGPAGGQRFRLSQATSPSPDFLRGLRLTLSPFCRRSPAHQGPGRCCRRVSWRLRRLRHLGPPSLGSLPQAFAAPATWRPRRLSTSPRGCYVIGRRRAAAGGLGPSLSCLSPGCRGEARAASLRPFRATGPARHPPPLTLSPDSQVAPRACAPAPRPPRPHAPGSGSVGGGGAQRGPAAQHLGNEPAPPPATGKPLLAPE